MSTPSGSTATPADERPTTSPAELAAHLRLTTTRLARRLRQETDVGLTPSQLSALSVIGDHGPIALGALAQRERVAPPSITKVVAKLEQEGLVQRAADPADRRFALVSLTEPGQSLLARSRQRKMAWLASRVRKLDASQQQALAAALDILDELVGPDRP